MLAGLLSSLLAGLLNGSFAAPMKNIKNWEWENTWMIYAIVAMLLGPFIVATLSVENLGDIYRSAGFNIVFITFITGVLFGIGSVTFGLGLHLAGLSLGYSLMVGLISVTGALVPMIIMTPELIPTYGGLLILLAMIVSVVGVIYCGNAGALKENSNAKRDNNQYKNTDHFRMALLVCITAGIFSSMLNISLVLGQPIADIASQTITGRFSSFKANNPVWAITLTGAFIPYLVYAIFLYRKNGSVKYFRTGLTNYLNAAFMGVLWFLCIVLYGAGASELGNVGTTIGWLILMSFTIISGNIWGVVTGEWKNAPALAKRKMKTGLTFLFIAVVLVSISKVLFN
jgi:L-rhamnose-H+ transport protein